MIVAPSSRHASIVFKICWATCDVIVATPVMSITTTRARLILMLLKSSAVSRWARWASI